MDGASGSPLPGLEVSAIAGKITSIVAGLHERAAAAADTETADRFDISLDTIYFASLLLMIQPESGRTRGTIEVLGALDTTVEIIKQLRVWIAQGGQ